MPAAPFKHIWVLIMIHSGWGRDNSIVAFKHEIASSIVTCHNPIIYMERVNLIVTGLFLPQYPGYLLNKTCFQIKKKSWTLNKILSQNVPPLLHVYWKSAFWNKIILWSHFRACVHGGGGPQIGEVTCLGSPHLSCKRDRIKMRDYMDRRVTPPKRVTSPT